MNAVISLGLLQSNIFEKLFFQCFSNVLKLNRKYKVLQMKFGTDMRNECFGILNC